MANIQIKSNQESVNPQLGQHVAPHANVTVPYEAGQKVWGSIRHGLDWYNSAEEQRDALRAVQASNQALEEIGKLKIDYTENYQGSNAENLTQRFQADSARIMNDCYANAKIRYKKSETMYNRAVGNAIANGNVWAYKYETDQLNKAKMDNVDIAAGNYYQNWKSGGMPLSQSISDLTDTVDFLFSNRPKEIREQIISQQIDRWAVDSVQEAMTTGNYGAAMAVLGETDKYLSPQVKTKLNGMVYKARTMNENYQIASYLANNGIVGDKAREYIKSLGINAAAKGNYGFNSGVSLDGMQEYAIAGLDGISGFLNFNGINDIIITSARGDYNGHVSGSSHNTGNAIDLDSATLAAMSPAQRNAIARNIEQMFAGVKVINEYDNPSSVSTGGHFHLDFTDYKPSNADATAMRTEQIIRMEDGMIAEQKRRERQQMLKNRQELNSKILGGGDLSSIMQEIQNSNLTPEEKALVSESMVVLTTGGKYGQPPRLYSWYDGRDLVKYTMNGDYIADWNTVVEYNNKSEDEKSLISDADKEKVRKAMARVNDLLSTIRPDKWNKGAYRDTQAYQDLINWINKATEAGKPKADVMRYIRIKSEDNGWNAEQIIADVPWSKMGKQNPQTKRGNYVGGVSRAESSPTGN